MHPDCSHPQAGHSRPVCHRMCWAASETRPWSGLHRRRAELPRVPPCFLWKASVWGGCFFQFVLQFLKLVPQFQNQSPVTTMNLKPPLLQEGWACVSPSPLNTGRPCFQPVPPGKSRVTHQERERRGVAYYHGLIAAQGIALLRIQSRRLHKESSFS